MSIRSLLFKPRWRHKDAGIRATAVSSGQEPELLAALPDICRQDESPEVRMAAARRVINLPILIAACSETDNANEQTFLTDRILSLASSAGADRAPLQDRLAALESSQDRRLIEAVAQQAPEAELRQSAIHRVERQGLLGDIAISDSDPDTRRLAAAGIKQQSTLARVISALRKTDKSLYQELQDRLRQERLQAGDSKAVAEEVQRICVAMEAVLLHESDADPHSFEPEWALIKAQVTTTQAQRYQGLVEQLAAPAQAQNSKRDSEPEETPGKEAEAASNFQPDTELDTEIEDGPAASAPPTDPKPVAHEPDHSPPKPDQKAAEADKAFADLEVKLEQLETALDDGDLKTSVDLQTEILAVGKKYRRDPRWRAVEARLRRRQGRLKELRDWQHWSNNKIRETLIAEMEVLPNSDLHPDAVLARVKELQVSWKHLERSEQIPGERHFSAPRGMWHQFQAAGNTAFEQAKPYLDKRSEVETRHLDEMRQALKSLEESASADPTDWTVLRSQLSKASTALRDLSGIPARERRKMAGQLRAAIGQARDLISKHHGDIEKAKLKLVREASALVHVADRQEAIDQAKSLQSAWKRAGSLPRGREQKLWLQFREPIDPLFEELKTEREAEQAASQEEREQQQEWIQSLKAILQSADEELPAASGRVLGLNENWGEIPRPDRKLREQFRTLQKDFDQRIEGLKTAQKAARRERCWKKAELLFQLESIMVAGEPAEAAVQELTEEWAAITGTEQEQTSELENALNNRFERASKGKVITTESDTSDQARHLCISLEFIAGLPSPAEDKDLRMKFQVDRLSESMTGSGERLTAAKEAEQAEREWLLMPPLNEKDHRRYGKRLRTALDEIGME